MCGMISKKFCLLVWFCEIESQVAQVRLTQSSLGWPWIPPHPLPPPHKCWSSGHGHSWLTCVFVFLPTPVPAFCTSRAAPPLFCSVLLLLYSHLLNQEFQIVPSHGFQSENASQNVLSMNTHSHSLRSGPTLYLLSWPVALLEGPHFPDFLVSS